MATSQMSEFIQHYCKATLVRNGDGPTDGQLLDEFIKLRDENALASLVRRHSALVWGVCSRLLWNYHDAEDAFQATFLVLVRRAASIASRELVANWLYSVAYQTALKARATAATRRAREEQVTIMPEPQVAVQERWKDLQPLLDQELSQLPEKYRALVVLCDLEGKTRKVVAAQLGLPEGTVAGRLARARILLAKRLARRGLVLTGGMLAAMLSEQAASAAVPSLVVSNTIKAVTLVAAGQATGAGVISAQVAELTRGVVKTKLLMNLTTSAAVVMGLGLLALSSAMLAKGTGEPQAPAPVLKEPQPFPKKFEAKKGEPQNVAAKKEQPKKEDVAAKRIIDRMVKAYDDCKSYRDSGIVKTLFIHAESTRIVEKPFTTAFVRPERFRFEYNEFVAERQMRYIICSDGKAVQSWWDIKPGIEKPESLSMALGTAAGVSDLTSLNIPELLMPKRLGTRRLALSHPQLLEDGKLDKVECYRVEGTWGGNPLILWIDKKSHLVRQIDEKATFDDFSTERTTTFEPIIDEKITDKMLEFDPPK